MLLEGPIQCSQEPAIFLSPERNEPTHVFRHYFSRILLNIIMPSAPRSSSGFFPSGLTTILFAFFISPLCAACLIHLILLDLITLILVFQKLPFLSCVSKRPCGFIRPQKLKPKCNPTGSFYDRSQYIITWKSVGWFRI